MILFRSEVGSRNWGYAIPSSDSDTRTVILPPKELYFAKFYGVEPAVEKDSNTDYTLDYFMGHVHTSNASAFEMLRSRIIHVNDLLDINQIIPQFDKFKLFHHFLGFGFRNLKLSTVPERSRIKGLIHTARCAMSADALSQDLLPETDIRELIKQTYKLPGHIGYTILEEALATRRLSEIHVESLSSGINRYLTDLDTIPRAKLPPRKTELESQQLKELLEDLTLKAKLKYYG